MIPRSRAVKSRSPCTVCVKRKVKCDREVPCSNCSKRGQQEKCIASNRVKLDKVGAEPLEYKQEYLKLWHEYRYWVFDWGLLQNASRPSVRQQSDWKTQIERADYWSNKLNMDMSFKLLDYSVEKLGGLYFGVLGDVGELYMELETYWARIRGDRAEYGPESYFWNAILWSVLTLTVHYIPLSVLEAIMFETQFSEFPTEVEPRFTEQLRDELVSEFINVTIQMLKRANFLECPNIRTIQTYLILASTPFPILEPALANSLLTHCLHLAKYWQIDQFRPLVADTPDLRLTKLACEKIWYRLCVHDYNQSGRNKPLSIHESNNSLLNHAAFLMDKPNVDVYQSEEMFETLLWKVTSLDRDLERYFTSQTKPPLKTLDAVQRQIDIFLHKIGNLDSKSSSSIRCEKFVVSFLLNVVNWKLSNLTYTYYDQDSGAAKITQLSTLLIAQVLNNIKSQMDYLNRLPIVLVSLVKILGFHSLCFIFDKSAINEQLALDISEIFQSKDLKYSGLLRAAAGLSERLRELRKLWKTVRIIDDGQTLNHPVFRILQDDISRFQEDSRRLNRVFLKSDDIAFESQEEEEAQSYEFMQIVRQFESAFSLQKILDSKV
ncbi:LANO_0G09164g1_1 [Lachancea nothofagi CBS 11611]|uniref:LANO_0G09164g1_1 n=1 Tax=Lachancea nothofagi CBS 11611 TaxID=1266666 RepID=A0A1G4KI69_9SACH|nr:LANO_0G09164g1_1 [Lachancea nothofagi CBS 11611]